LPVTWEFSFACNGVVSRRSSIARGTPTGPPHESRSILIHNCGRWGDRLRGRPYPGKGELAPHGEPACGDPVDLRALEECESRQISVGAVFPASTGSS
jgi:hypothetical protein